MSLFETWPWNFWKVSKLFSPRKITRPSSQSSLRTSLNVYTHNELWIFVSVAVRHHFKSIFSENGRFRTSLYFSIVTRTPLTDTSNYLTQLFLDKNRSYLRGPYIWPLEIFFLRLLVSDIFWRNLLMSNIFVAMVTTTTLLFLLITKISFQMTLKSS